MLKTIGITIMILGGIVLIIVSTYDYIKMKVGTEK